MSRRGNRLYDTHKCLIDTYNSEYQSMQSRITAYITIQLGVWPSLIVVLSFIANIYMHHKINQIFFYWGSLLTVIGAAQIYYFALHEVYNNTLYIEKYLKPRMSKILRKKSFWRWESHLAKTGKSNPAWFGDFIFMAPPLLAFGYIIIKRLSSWSYWDCIMVAVSMFALCALPLPGSIKSYRARKAYEKVLKTAR